MPPQTSRLYTSEAAIYPTGLMAFISPKDAALLQSSLLRYRKSPEKGSGISRFSKSKKNVNREAQQYFAASFSFFPCDTPPSSPTGQGLEGPVDANDELVQEVKTNLHEAAKHHYIKEILQLRRHLMICTGFPTMDPRVVRGETTPSGLGAEPDKTKFPCFFRIASNAVAEPFLSDNGGTTALWACMPPSTVPSNKSIPVTERATPSDREASAADAIYFVDVGGLWCMEDQALPAAGASDDHPLGSSFSGEEDIPCESLLSNHSTMGGDKAKAALQLGDPTFTADLSSLSMLAEQRWSYASKLWRRCCGHVEKSQMRRFPLHDIVLIVLDDSTNHDSFFLQSYRLISLSQPVADSASESDGGEALQEYRLAGFPQHLRLHLPPSLFQGCGEREIAVSEQRSGEPMASSPLWWDIPTGRGSSAAAPLCFASVEWLIFASFFREWTPLSDFQLPFSLRQTQQDCCSARGAVLLFPHVMNRAMQCVRRAMRRSLPLQSTSCSNQTAEMSLDFPIQPTMKCRHRDRETEDEALFLDDLSAGLLPAPQSNRLFLEVPQEPEYWELYLRLGWSATSAVAPLGCSSSVSSDPFNSGVAETAERRLEAFFTHLDLMYISDFSHRRIHEAVSEDVSTDGGLACQAPLYNALQSSFDRLLGFSAELYHRAQQKSETPATSPLSVQLPAGPNRSKCEKTPHKSTPPAPPQSSAPSALREEPESQHRGGTLPRPLLPLSDAAQALRSRLITANSSSLNGPSEFYSSASMLQCIDIPVVEIYTTDGEGLDPLRDVAPTDDVSLWDMSCHQHAAPNPPFISFDGNATASTASGSLIYSTELADVIEVQQAMEQQQQTDLLDSTDSAATTAATWDGDTERLRAALHDAFSGTDDGVALRSGGLDATMDKVWPAELLKSIESFFSVYSEPSNRSFDMASSPGTMGRSGATTCGVDGECFAEGDREAAVSVGSTVGEVSVRSPNCGYSQNGKGLLRPLSGCLGVKKTELAGEESLEQIILSAVQQHQTEALYLLSLLQSHCLHATRMPHLDTAAVPQSSDGVSSAFSWQGGTAAGGEESDKLWLPVQQLLAAPHLIANAVVQRLVQSFWEKIATTVRSQLGGLNAHGQMETEATQNASSLTSSPVKHALPLLEEAASQDAACDAALADGAAAIERLREGGKHTQSLCSTVLLPSAGGNTEAADKSLPPPLVTPTGLNAATVMALYMQAVCRDEATKIALCAAEQSEGLSQAKEGGSGNPAIASEARLPLSMAEPRALWMQHLMALLSYGVAASTGEVKNLKKSIASATVIPAASSEEEVEAMSSFQKAIFEFRALRAGRVYLDAYIASALAAYADRWRSATSQRYSLM